MQGDLRTVDRPENLETAIAAKLQRQFQSSSLNAAGANNMTIDDADFTISSSFNGTEPSRIAAKSGGQLRHQS